jgi:hypothetical protein
MDTAADPRMRAVVLDTGAPRPAAHAPGRTTRAVLGAAIAAALLAGAITAGSWSIMTAVRGGTPADQPPPLWYPTSDADATGDRRATVPRSTPTRNPLSVPVRPRRSAGAVPSGSRSGGGQSGPSSTVSPTG